MSLKRVVFSVLCIAAYPCTAQTYNLIGLGTLGGSESYAQAINAGGQVVGWSYTTNNDQHAFLYSNGTMQDLGTPSGTQSTAYAINSSGQIVGWNGTSDNGGENARAFVYSNGVMHDLTSMLPAETGWTLQEALGINDAGSIVGLGYISPIGEHAFLLQNGVVEDLGTLGAGSSEAFGINNIGQVAGESYTPTNQTEAFLWFNGVMQNINTLGGSSTAQAINAAGQVVGFYNMGTWYHAYLYGSGTMTDLGALTQNSAAFDINNLGQVVGGSDGFGFLYSNGHMTNLDNLLVNTNAGWGVLQANGINDAGQIVGYGARGGGSPEAILLLPILAASGAAAEPPKINDGLVAYYPLAGNGNDLSGNGNNATLVGGVTESSNRFGDSGAALFVPTNGTISVPSSTEFQSSAATVSFWYQPETNILSDQPNNWFCVLLSSAPDHHPLLFFNNSPGSGAAGTPAMTLGYWNQTFYSANYQMPIGRWTHLCLVVSGSTRTIYANGSQIYQASDYFGNTAYPITEIGNFSGDVNTHSARGSFADVRFYDRSLSSAEVQQLANQQDIGQAPATPAVTNVNRLPTPSELGTRSIPSNFQNYFEVFTNGAFETNVLPNPALMTVVLTHGWDDSPNTWPLYLAQVYDLFLGDQMPNIVAWNWSNDAYSSYLDLTKIALKTPGQGLGLGQALLQALGSNYSEKIHFIGHSLGTLVNAGAADYLHGDSPNAKPIKTATAFMPSNTQMTLFDEAEVALGSGSLSQLETTLAADDATPQPAWNRATPKQAAWIDNYISMFGLLHSNAVNVVLTNIFIQDAGLFYVIQDLTELHNYPPQWYVNTVGTPYASLMGFRWAFENSGSQADRPNTNTVFVNTDATTLGVRQIDWASGAAILDSRLRSVLGPVKYALLPAVANAIQAHNNVTAEEQDALVTDPYLLGIGPFEAWSTLVKLTVSLLPKANGLNPLSPTRPIPEDSTNTSAYAWLPIGVPDGATLMSFDFMVTGETNQEEFVAAFGGTNIFGLDTVLLETNEWFNTGPIDVSAFAGTTNELFLGLNGTGLSAASVTVSGIRFYSPSPPSMYLTLSDTNVTITWPLSAASWILESATDLSSPNWVPVSNIVQSVQLQAAVAVEREQQQFYRLRLH